MKYFIFVTFHKPSSDTNNIPRLFLMTVNKILENGFEVKPSRRKTNCSKSYHKKCIHVSKEFDSVLCQSISLLFSFYFFKDVQVSHL